MSDDRQETTDDIIESMERFASSHWMHDEGQNVREFAARLKSALKRERAAFDCECAGIAELAAKEEAARHTPGNSAAMREALREAIGETCAGCSRDCDDCINLKSGWMKKAKAALSAPARNCDKMPDIANLTMHDLAKSPCKSTLEYASRDELLELVRWLLAPAAERSGETQRGGD